MSPEQTDEESEPIEPDATDEPPPPPPEEEPPAPETPAEREAPFENAWDDDYDELVEPEEPPRRKKKFRHWGAVIVTCAVIIFLIGWTVVSPRVMVQVGSVYVDSPTYASWGNFTGTRDIWAGKTVWGVSVSGHNTSAGNRTIQVDVLITKVFEKPGNWFFRGTAIELRNVSLFTMDGTFVASMSNQTDLKYGISASIPVTFAAGDYDLYVSLRFLVSEVMRIGYLPLETVNVEKVYIEPTIHVD